MARHAVVAMLLFLLAAIGEQTFSSDVLSMYKHLPFMCGAEAGRGESPRSFRPRQPDIICEGGRW